MKRLAAGFTLIELLISIAIMAMLLTALLSFVFSMTEIWGRSSDRRLFDQHVNAVTHHLQSMLRRATLPRPGQTTDEAFSFLEVRTASLENLNGLTFTLADGDRLLKWGDEQVPFAQCTLGIAPDRGLIIFWRSMLEDQENPPREKLLSPLITDLTWSYYEPDAQRWRAERAPLRNSAGLWRVPEQIVLHFKLRDLTAERTLTLPLAPKGQPLF